MADCVNSSPPRISRNVQGIWGIFAKGIQWKRVCMALNMNFVGIPGDCRATLGFWENLGLWEVSRDLGPQKAFAQIANA